MKNALFVLLLVVASDYTHAAAKPITGVSCGGGFFIRTPNGHLHWVLPKAESSVKEVYSGDGSLYAMTECGTGVVSVFKKNDLYTAYYSPNCLSIGNVENETLSVYKKNQPIKAFSQSGNGLVTTLQGGDKWQSSNCQDIAQPPSLLLKQ